MVSVLMARGDSFEPNEAGISIMLMYHASLITHGTSTSASFHVTLAKLVHVSRHFQHEPRRCKYQ